MTRFCLVLLVVGLVCILVVVGCGRGDGSPMVTVTPKSARDLPPVTPTPVPTINRSEPTPDGPSGPRRSGCYRFATWAEAMAAFEANGGPEKDPLWLDPDTDGIPCETLREQKPGG